MYIYLLLIGFIFLLAFLDKVVLKKVGFDMETSNRTRMRTFNKLEKSVDSGPLFLVAVLVLYFFTAFRFNVGWDYMAYYNTIKYFLVTNIIENGERLNVLLIDLSRILNITNLYFAVSSFIIIFFIVLTILKYSNNVWLSLIFFITFPLFYLNSLSVIRTFMGVAISFFGFRYIEEEKPIRYFFTIIIASMFHTSALICLIFYFARYINLTIPKMLIIMFTLPIIGSILTNIIFAYFPRYTVYLEQTTVQEGTKAIIIFVVLGVVSVILKNHIVRNDKVSNIYFNLYYIGLCIYLIFLQEGTLGHRLSLYGTIYSLLLIPKVISLFSRKVDRYLILSLVYLISISAFFYTIYGGRLTYIPYQTIWYGL